MAACWERVPVRRRRRRRGIRDRRQLTGELDGSVLRAQSFKIVPAGPERELGPAGKLLGRQPAEQMKAAGIKHVVYFEAPGTAHEFQTWRKSLHEFGPMLFQN